jgi:integrase
MDMDIGYIPYQQMINKESKIVSAKTVSNSYDLVRHALDYAKFPRPVVKLPTIVKAERKWLDYEQIQSFTSALRGKPYELGALLALHGLRRSELLHLTAEDIDVDNGIIRVRGASVVGEGNKLVSKKSNKNRTSTRTVHIVIPQLKDLVKGKEGTLITTNPTTLYGSINGLCERNGLPAVGVHGLRHSWVSLCFHLHWDPQTVMREGGYSNMQTINEIYRHLAAQDANEDIKSMQEFFTT